MDVQPVAEEYRQQAEHRCDHHGSIPRRSSKPENREQRPGEKNRKSRVYVVGPEVSQKRDGRGEQQGIPWRDPKEGLPEHFAARGLPQQRFSEADIKKRILRCDKIPDARGGNNHEQDHPQGVPYPRKVARSDVPAFRHSNSAREGVPPDAELRLIQTPLLNASRHGRIKTHIPQHVMNDTP